uniref:Uncharacterized protein n=1 Tax=Rhizophora mucronata TaxID=61149 RepID=A0A2P2QEN2_RHIMU
MFKNTFSDVHLDFRRWRFFGFFHQRVLVVFKMRSCDPYTSISGGSGGHTLAPRVYFFNGLVSAFVLCDLFIFVR